MVKSQGSPRGQASCDNREDDFGLPFPPPPPPDLLPRLSRLASYCLLAKIGVIVGLAALAAALELA